MSRRRRRKHKQKQTTSVKHRDTTTTRTRKPRHKNMFEVFYSSLYLEEMIYNLKKDKAPSLAGSVHKTTAKDTRANPNHTYNQYIHRATADYGYRYYIVNKGLSVKSRVFPNLKICHAACLDVIENGKDIHL